MKMIKLFLAICFTFILSSCGEDNSTGPIHYIEGNDKQESRSLALKGSFCLNSKIIPVDIDIDVVDENLDSITTVKATLERERNGSFIFKTDLKEYFSPIVRIRYTCVYGDSSSKIKMEFIEYIDMDKNSKPVLNLPMALASERIKFLVQKDGFYLDRAKQKTLREIYDLLDFKENKNVDIELDSNSYIRTELIRHLDAITVVEINDSVFYKNYNALRSAVGTEKKWKDIFSETEIADITFTYDPNGSYKDIWMKSFGLSQCDSANYQDTIKVSNKKSIYNNTVLLCDLKKKTYQWRFLNDFEKEIGLCPAEQRDTVIYDNIVYVCDSGTTIWSIMSGKEALPYMHVDCNRIYEGSIVKYDSTDFICIYEKGKYLWTNIIDDNYNWRDNVDVFVKNKGGLCNTDSSAEKTAIIGNRYYQCSDSIWKEVDRLTYYLGSCNKNKLNVKAMHDSVGYFICNDKWVEITIPQYKGDSCTKEFERNIKQYNERYYICREKNIGTGRYSYYWDVATDNETSAPIKKGHFCEKENTGEIIEIDSVAYRCVFPQWTVVNEFTEFEITTHRAMERNNFPKDYCKNGIVGTSLFWDKTDSTLYGCVDKYTSANFGWGRVAWSNYNRSIIKLNSPEKIAGGIYEDPVDSVGHKFFRRYSATVDGWTLYFSFNTSSVNSSVSYMYLQLHTAISPEGETFDIAEWKQTSTIRATVGGEIVLVDSIKEKSPSFDKYFANWKNKIIESTQCPVPLLQEFNCVSNWDDSDFEITFRHYNEKSYMTWDQAKAFCPEGTHIPSAEELTLNIYPHLYTYERVTLVQQKMKDGVNGKFSANYNLFWTSTEKDAETQYCLEYVEKPEDSAVVASGIVECPKDLYPMVQVFCINDGRNP